MQNYKITLLQYYTTTVLQYYKITLLQHYNITILYCNITVLQLQYYNYNCNIHVQLYVEHRGKRKSVPCSTCHFRLETNVSSALVTHDWRPFHRQTHSDCVRKCSWTRSGARLQDRRSVARHYGKTRSPVVWNEAAKPPMGREY